jgi:hypothetical protein
LDASTYFEFHNHPSIREHTTGVRFARWASREETPLLFSRRKRFDSSFEAALPLTCHSLVASGSEANASDLKP